MAEIKSIFDCFIYQIPIKPKSIPVTTDNKYNELLILLYIIHTDPEKPEDFKTKMTNMHDHFSNSYYFIPQLL